MLGELPFISGVYDPLKPKPRISSNSVKRVQEPPPLLEAQMESFEWFQTKGVKQLFSLINPVTDPTGDLWEVNFVDIRFGDPNRGVEEALLKDRSYDAPLYTTVRLTNKKTGVVKEKEIFFMDFPIMTKNGNFVHNGVARAVIHQLIRAEGVTFLPSKMVNSDGDPIFMAKLRPQRGSWIEFVINRQGVIFLKLMQGNARIPLTMLLKALGVGSNSEIIDLFSDVDTGEIKYIESCLKFDLTVSQDDAALTIYRMIRSDETVGVQTAIRYIRSLFFDVRKFYLGRVGRYQMCKKFNKKLVEEEKNYKLRLEDLIDISKRLIQINNRSEKADDVDSLTNRRVRSVGELLVSQLERSIVRMEKNIKDRLSMHGVDSRVTPKMVINSKPLKSALNLFLGTNSLSRFLDQENILAELENKRRVTASGPGGVAADRATFSIRDIHYSQYGRMCPVKTPEKMNIGVVTHLGIYSRINKYGFIEVLYRLVKKEIKVTSIKDILNRIPEKDIKNKSGKVVFKKGERIGLKNAKGGIKDIIGKTIKVEPFISNEVKWIDPYEELDLTVSVSTLSKDKYENITAKIVPARHRGEFKNVEVGKIDIVDVTPSQVGSVSLALIPFAGNTDSARLLMGTNMTNQAVPLVKSEAPIVGTGFEKYVAHETGWGVYAEEDGVVTYVDSEKIMFKGKSGKEYRYDLLRYKQSNQNMSFTQVPRVSVKNKLKRGELLADGPSMMNGELALGKNVLVAYMFLDGFNFEDGFVVSEKLVKEDHFTSVHVSTYTVDIRETKLGPEQITKDIPGVPDRSLRNLDEDGIVSLGASVSGGDILAGVIAPKGEHELSAEERLLRAIFGEPSREVVDNSLRVPYGDSGVVTKVHILDVEKGDKLRPGVLRQVKVWVASTKKISLGDKLAGRYGDKGTITKILPVEDMPHLSDGTPIDIILNPLIIKRMNLGQLLETYYSNIAYSKGVNLAFPNFESVDEAWFADVKKGLGLPETNMTDIYDGRTGKRYENKIAVGFRYIMRLKHIASEKIHARSTGPYTMVTQQPLAGRSHRGGQRFGEMEVWALEAYGAAHTLQEMLTIKSDDVEGRASAYKSILNGDPIEVVKVPASFKVLIRQLNSLGLKVDLIDKNKKADTLRERKTETREGNK